MSYRVNIYSYCKESYARKFHAFPRECPIFRLPTPTPLMVRRKKTTILKTKHPYNSFYTTCPLALSPPPSSLLPSSTSTRHNAPRVIILRSLMVPGFSHPLLRPRCYTVLKRTCTSPPARPSRSPPGRTIPSSRLRLSWRFSLRRGRRRGLRILWIERDEVSGRL